LARRLRVGQALAGGGPAYPLHFGTRFVPSRMWYHAL
jgi:hypothetical protein